MKHANINQTRASEPQVLVVDDNANSCHLLNLLLAPKYAVLEAHSGESALQAIARHQPRLVLLDVMMPGELDGLQVLDAIKRNPELKHIVVGMVSARDQSADDLEARRRGADAYFTKPFSPRGISAWVDSRLQQSPLTAEF